MKTKNGRPPIVQAYMRLQEIYNEQEMNLKVLDEYELYSSEIHGAIGYALNAMEELIEKGNY